MGRGPADPELLAACRRWGATVEGPLAADHAAVLAVRLADGSEAVAKRPPPGDAPDEAAALRAWAGIGAVWLLDEAPAGCLLLERLSPGHPTTDDREVAQALARLWIGVPAGHPWRDADALAAGRWPDTIRRQRMALGPRVADAAATTFEEGLGGGPRVLLHGDGHHGNVLSSTRGWVAIDPQPLAGPPALDLVPALFNGPAGPVGERIAALAGEAGVDPADLRRLALARCVLSEAWHRDAGTASDGRALALAVELLDG